jgi:hypothetical protein
VPRQKPEQPVLFRPGERIGFGLLSLNR